MNCELFTAFLLITIVLIITPGPIVTLVIATGASQGVRAALITVAGTTLGNALLIAAIALGLSWVLRTRSGCSKCCAGPAPPIWSGSASRHGATPATGRGAAQPAREFLARHVGGADQSEDHRVLHGVPAAIRRSGLPAERQLAVMCAVAVPIAAYPIPPGRSRPASAAPGSCSRRARNCWRGCPVSR